MKKRLISIDVTTGSYKGFVEGLVQIAGTRTSAYVCIANVRLLVKAYQDKVLARIVNDADVVIPDGMPLAIAFKTFYGLHQDRVSGVDLLPGLLKAAEQNNIPVFFYGSSQEILDQTWEYCDQNYPGLDVAGVQSAPMHPHTEEEQQELIRKINYSRAAFVFVALNASGQERWMAGMKGKINACMIGIGDSLPVVVKIKKRAPQWMQQISMEWFFCLLQEPFRLFRVYLITNSIYIWLFSRTWINKRFRSRGNEFPL